MSMEYFCAYHSYLKAVRRLSDAECGRLFKACLEYSMTGAEPELAGNERFVFDAIEGDIDRAKAAYQKKCDDNRKHVQKRWEEAKKNTESDTNVYERTNANTNVYERTNKSKERQINNITQSFTQFWAVYPRRVAKKNAISAWNKLNPDDELVKTILDSIEKQKQSASWTQDGGKYIPYPSTWLNERRWEDELEPAETNSLPKLEIGEDGYAHRV